MQSDDDVTYITIPTSRQFSEVEMEDMRYLASAIQRYSRDPDNGLVITFDLGIDCE